jgi:hypothetical protein
MTRLIDKITRFDFSTAQRVIHSFIFHLLLSILTRSQYYAKVVASNCQLRVGER